jgi:hypothetical protein
MDQDTNPGEAYYRSCHSDLHKTISSSRDEAPELGDAAVLVTEGTVDAAGTGDHEPPAEKNIAAAKSQWYPPRALNLPTG